MIPLQFCSFPNILLDTKFLKLFPTIQSFNLLFRYFCLCPKDDFSTLDVLSLQYDFVPVHKKFSEFALLWDTLALLDLGYVSSRWIINFRGEVTPGPCWFVSTGLQRRLLSPLLRNFCPFIHLLGNLFEFYVRNYFPV